MIKRPYWLDKINSAWQKRSIIWLSGVRRVGKTTLSKMLPNAEYYNCDLPSTARILQDPEQFFNQISPDSILIFDEIHKVSNPSQILKIGADEFPNIKILATGSSTLAATSKFKDALTGRKVSLYLPPVLWTECKSDFGIAKLDKRLLHGGLPEPLLANKKDPSFFSEWIDSFYARDVQELFSIRNRTGFLKLLHLLLRQSGGLLDYTHLAKLSELSRPTVKSHIEALTIANALYLLPPFHGGGRREITKRPKGYTFDTGFITFAKGWTTIQEDNLGILWEHLILDVLRCFVDPFSLYYWRDKSSREIDFIITGSGNKIDAIEAKINPDNINMKNVIGFRESYPQGRNIVLCPYLSKSYRAKKGQLLLEFYSLAELIKKPEILI